MIERIENTVIRRYGFESKITIAVFRMIDLLRKLAR